VDKSVVLLNAKQLYGSSSYDNEILVTVARKYKTTTAISAWYASSSRATAVLLPMIWQSKGSIAYCIGFSIGTRKLTENGSNDILFGVISLGSFSDTFQ
jgi:hypothetical protein